MNRLYGICIALLLAILNTIAQNNDFNDFRKEALQDFDNFKANEMKEFNDFRDKANMEFANFMRQTWKEF